MIPKPHHLSGQRSRPRDRPRSPNRSFPCPRLATDYDLFIADERVRRAEFIRRVASACEDWTRVNGAGRFGQGPPPEVRRRPSTIRESSSSVRFREWKAANQFG